MYLYFGGIFKWALPIIIINGTLQLVLGLYSVVFSIFKNYNNKPCSNLFVGDFFIFLFLFIYFVLWIDELIEKYKSKAKKE